MSIKVFPSFERTSRLTGVSLIKALDLPEGITSLLRMVSLS